MRLCELFGKKVTLVCQFTVPARSLAPSDVPRNRLVTRHYQGVMSMIGSEMMVVQGVRRTQVTNITDPDDNDDDVPDPSFSHIIPFCTFRKSAVRRIILHKTAEQFPLPEEGEQVEEGEGRTADEAESGRETSTSNRQRASVGSQLSRSSAGGSTTSRPRVPLSPFEKQACITFLREYLYEKISATVGEDEVPSREAVLELHFQPLMDECLQYIAVRLSSFLESLEAPLHRPSSPTGEHPASHTVSLQLPKRNWIREYMSASHPVVVAWKADVRLVLVDKEYEQQPSHRDTTAPYPSEEDGNHHDVPEDPPAWLAERRALFSAIRRERAADSDDDDEDDPTRRRPSPWMLRVERLMVLLKQLYAADAITGILLAMVAGILFAQAAATPPLEAGNFIFEYQQTNFYFGLAPGFIGITLGIGLVVVNRHDQITPPRYRKLLHVGGLCVLLTLIPLFLDTCYYLHHGHFLIHQEPVIDYYKRHAQASSDAICRFQETFQCNGYEQRCIESAYLFALAAQPNSSYVSTFETFCARNCTVGDVGSANLLGKNPCRSIMIEEFDMIAEQFLVLACIMVVTLLIRCIMRCCAREAYHDYVEELEGINSREGEETQPV